MSEPYLILHKVRGEPAFDIANKVSCTHCDGTDDAVCQCNWHKSGKLGPCGMCKGEGFFWIIPTSGHRAYPLFAYSLNHLPEMERQHLEDIWNTPFPVDWPDHYDTKREDDRSTHLANIARDILLRKGTIKAKPVQAIHRRF